MANDGVLYMINDSGIITTLDATTGELFKQGRATDRGNYYASILASTDLKERTVAANGVIFGQLLMISRHRAMFPAAERVGAGFLYCPDRLKLTLTSVLIRDCSEIAASGRTTTSLFSGSSTVIS